MSTAEHDTWRQEVELQTRRNAVLSHRQGSPSNLPIRDPRDAGSRSAVAVPSNPHAVSCPTDGLTPSPSSSGDDIMVSGVGSLLNGGRDGMGTRQAEDDELLQLQKTVLMMQQKNLALERQKIKLEMAKLEAERLKLEAERRKFSIEGDKLQRELL